MIAIGKRDIGLKRQVNEDHIFVQNTPIGALKNLYVVADGMGGHQCGDLASKLAIDTLCNYIESHNDVQLKKSQDVLTLLRSSVIHANEMVYRQSKQCKEHAGMGTTLIVCTIDEEMLYVAHVGDSRVYWLNKVSIKQLTTDHSYVQEMVDCGMIKKSEMNTHPKKHIITRAVGTYESVKVDTIVKALEDTEFILLCSDGLTNMVEDMQIHRIVYERDEMELQDIVESLIREANEKGGKDNIAVVIGKRGEATR